MIVVLSLLLRSPRERPRGRRGRCQEQGAGAHDSAREPAASVPPWIARARPLLWPPRAERAISPPPARGPVRAASSSLGAARPVRPRIKQATTVARPVERSGSRGDRDTPANGGGERGRLLFFWLWVLSNAKRTILTRSPSGVWLLAWSGGLKRDWNVGEGRAAALERERGTAAATAAAATATADRRRRRRDTPPPEHFLGRRGAASLLFPRSFCLTMSRWASRSNKEALPGGKEGGAKEEGGSFGAS